MVVIELRLVVIDLCMVVFGLCLSVFECVWGNGGIFLSVSTQACV